MSAGAVRAYVGLGSNLGDRRAALDFAVRQLARDPRSRVVRVSDWIETEPVGGPPGQGRYLNGALELATRRSPRQLLSLLLEIEVQAGRIRRERDGPRILDLDLLLYGNESLDEPGLHVPHPRLEERAFVLEPLAQIAPDLELPTSGQAVRGRLAALRAVNATAD